MKSLEQHTSLKTKEIQRNQKFSIRFRKDEKNITSSWSIMLSKGIIERAEMLECTYIHFSVNTLLKEIHVKLCKNATTLEELPLTTKSGKYRKVIYARNVITSIQNETNQYFKLMNTYVLTEHPLQSNVFVYYFGYLKEK